MCEDMSATMAYFSRPLHRRHEVELDAVDGLVGADVQVGGVRTQLPALLRRHGGEAARLAGGRHVDVGIAPRFLDRLAGPGTGLHEVDGGRLRLAAGEIQRNQGILAKSPALHEQDLVVGGDVQQFAQVGFRLRVDRNEFGAAVAHLHHGHAAAMPVEHLGGRLLEDFFREDGRAGGKVEYLGHRACGLIYRRRLDGSAPSPSESAASSRAG
jgi:hypothetical protein